jgi:pimeloyl-ACP methyl ester carboxylesterase
MQLSDERRGSGDPLVLVHGITERGESWRPLIEPLAAVHDVLVVDLRGHGASPPGDAYDPFTLAGDVHDTVVASGLDGTVAPVMVGHSLGGVVVSAYAAAFPTRGVINVDQPLRLAAFKEALGPIEPMVRGDQASCEEAIAMVFSMMNGPLQHDEVERIGALRQVDQSVVLGVWGTVFESTAEELDAQVEQLAGSIRVPYLSLHGDDPGADYQAWLTRLIPSATVEVWPEHGHYPHLVDQARFLARVEAFIAEL